MSNHQGDAAITAREQEPEQNQASATEEVTQSTLSEQQSGNVPAPSAERQTELAHPTAEQAQPEREPATGSDAELQATQTGQASAQPAPSSDQSSAQPGPSNEASAQLASSAETSTQPSSESAAQPPQPSSEPSPQATQSVPSAEASTQSAQPAPSSEAPAQSAPASELSTETPVQSAAAPSLPEQAGDREEGVANSANVQAAPGQESTLGEFDPRPDMSDQGFQQLLPKLLGLFDNNREKLARAIGLHRSTVDRWLNGKSKPNTSTVLRMRRLAQERGVE